MEVLCVLDEGLLNKLLLSFWLFCILLLLLFELLLLWLFNVRFDFEFGIIFLQFGILHGKLYAFSLVLCNIKEFDLLCFKLFCSLFVNIGEDKFLFFIFL